MASAKSGSPSGYGRPRSGISPAIPPQDLLLDAFIANAPRAPLPGSDTMVPTLGGIPLIAKLGQGGMGAVYYGIHPRLEIDVAVKVLPFYLAEQNPDVVERFVREAKTAAKIESPHLVSVKDVNQERGLHYIVMEFVRGRSAGSLLRVRAGTGASGMAEADALDICIAACKGLAAAHADGIVHRDVKPDNILIPFKRRPGGTSGYHRAYGAQAAPPAPVRRPVLPWQAHGEEELDFGAAKLADLGLARMEGVGQSLTGAATCMGTPGFMAPEQAEDARSVGEPADVFATGASLYALLCGRPPFIGNSLVAVLDATRQKPHDPVRKLRPDASAATAELVDRCLTKDPLARCPDAARLLEALNACRGALVAAAPGRASAPAQAVPSAGSTVANAAAGTSAVTELDGTRPPMAPSPAAAEGERSSDSTAVLRGGAADRSGLSTLAPAADGPTEAPSAPSDESKGTRIQGSPPAALAFAAQRGKAASRQEPGAASTPGQGRPAADAKEESEEPPAARQVRPERPLGSGDRQAPARRFPFKLAAGIVLIALAAGATWYSLAGPRGPKAGLPATMSLSLGEGVRLDLVLIPRGSLTMGSPEGEEGRDSDETLHEVTIGKPFYLGKYEVTQAQYAAVTSGHPSEFKGADSPVENVSWYDAQSFCKKLSEDVGQTVRLPTEAEWEYACRAGTRNRFCTGNRNDDLDAIAWHADNSNPATHHVGRKNANGWGLHDMLGNVREWCLDWSGDYPQGAALDPQGAAKGDCRVLRGGSWSDCRSFCRSANRMKESPVGRSNCIGFRVAVEPPRAP